MSVFVEKKDSLAVRGFCKIQFIVSAVAGPMTAAWASIQDSMTRTAAPTDGALTSR